MFNSHSGIFFLQHCIYYILLTKHKPMATSTLLSHQLSTFLSSLESTCKSLPDVPLSTTADPDNATALNDNELFEAGHDDDDWFLAGLEHAKLNRNIDLARDMIYSLPPQQPQAQAQVQPSELKARLGLVNKRARDADMVFRSRAQHLAAVAAAKAAAEAEAQAAAKSAPSSPTTTSPDTSKQDLTLTQKVQIQSQTQDSIAADILSLVRQLRSDAVSFSERLVVDTDVVAGTAATLEKSAGVMGRVGGRLGEYQRSTAIGWWFYIWAVVFLVAAIVGSMIVIRLFPKW